MDFWSGNFGKEYTDRTFFSDLSQWDKFISNRYGISKTQMFEDFIGNSDKGIKILEVGCNTGNQLRALQHSGFTNLYGIELQWYAVEKAKSITKNINIIQCSGFDIPFKDQYFDLVMTNGVLIHIAPKDLSEFMNEIHRCTSKYILGFEYYADGYTSINYRGNDDRLWKADYAKLYIDQFPELKLIKEKIYPYIIKSEKGNQDCMFLISK